MHITTVDVISANGKITKGQDAHAHTWASDEDWEHFVKLRDSYDLIVMGGGTYDVIQPEPQPGQLRVVLTSRPGKYKDQVVPGQLEFINATPKDVVKLLEKRGYKRMLLVGGKVNSSFWDAELVNEAYVTVEPFLFGQGRNLADGVDVYVVLRLLSVQKLNERGTLLLHYTVDKG